MLCWLGVVRGSEAELTRQAAQQLLKRGGVALVLRHGQTESGIGDPPNFKLGDCKTQRNLSAEGRRELRAMASSNKAAGVSFTRVYAGQWCRTHDTAALLAEPPTVPQEWVVLNSQFPGNPVVTDANAQITQRLRSMPANESWLLVTHQVNIASLTGISPASGEGVLVRITQTGLVVLGRVTL